MTDRRKYPRDPDYWRAKVASAYEAHLSRTLWEMAPAYVAITIALVLIF